MQISISNISAKIYSDLLELNFIEKADMVSYGSSEYDNTYDVVLKDTVMIHTNCKVWLETHCHKYSLECFDFREVKIV